MARKEFEIKISGYVEEPGGEQDVARATEAAHRAADLALRSAGGEAMDAGYEMIHLEDQASELRRRMGQ